MHDGSITILCKNDLNEVERLQHTICQFCDLHGVARRFQHAFNLSLDEIVTNIIRHGYDNRSAHQISVRIELAGNELSAKVEDDARAFNPAEHPAPDCAKPLAERQPGGLGIPLVRSLVSRMEYHREDGKNVLTIFKRVQ